MDTNLETKVAEAIKSINLGNNGYADIGNNREVADKVAEQGYIVLRTKGLHGLPVYRGFTTKAQEALAKEPFGVPTVNPCLSINTGEQPDYEAAILARQERHMANF